MLAPIIESFYGIMKCVSTSLVAVIQLVESMKSFHELFQLCWSDEFLQVFERYMLPLSTAANDIKVAKHCFPASSNIVKKWVQVFTVFQKFEKC